jgi:hypothetical protein
MRKQEYARLCYTKKTIYPETPSGHLSDRHRSRHDTANQQSPQQEHTSFTTLFPHKTAYLLALLSLLPPKTENLGLVGSPSPLPPLPLPPPTIDLIVSLSIPNCVSQTLAKTP